MRLIKVKGESRSDVGSLPRLQSLNLYFIENGKLLTVLKLENDMMRGILRILILRIACRID